MRILMLAPQPFFRARGTPISVLQRVHALTSLGHTIDLVTYPFGEPVTVPGLTTHRCARVPLVRDVRVGPSPAKILLDAALLFRAIQLLRRGGYDLLHTHEEAAFMGAWLSRRYGIKHLYDMHSSLPQQFGNFGRYDWRPITALFRRLERYALERADLLITICPALEQQVEQAGYSRPHAMIENTYDLAPAAGDPDTIRSLRASLGLEGRSIVVYTGTLERYQGVDLLLEAARRVHGVLPDSHFLIVGGTKEQAQALERAAEERGIAGAVSFVPSVAPGEVGRYQSLATALVTCRTRGTNTPLKIYEYLRAGRPIVATAIHSHTQVLDGSCAELVEPTEDGVARGLIRVLSDPAHAASLARGARRYSEERYGRERYLARLEALLSHLTPQEDAPSGRGSQQAARAVRASTASATLSAD